MSDAKPKSTRPFIGGDASKASHIIRWQYGLYVWAVGILIVLAIVHIRHAIVERAFLRPAVLLTLVCLASSRVIFSHIKSDFARPANGLEVSAAEPTLVAFVQDAANALGSRMPDEIFLTNQVELRIEENNERFGLRVGESVLFVGVPLMKAMDQREFAALLGHELADFAPSSVPEGVRAFRALKFATRLIRRERGSALDGVFGNYARKIFRSVGAIGVAQEDAAERAAADAYGTEALLSALRKMHDVRAAWDQMLREYAVPALQSERHPVGLYEGFATILASPVRASQRSRDTARWRALERDWYELHRNASDRIAELTTWPEIAASIPIPRTPAIDLLDADADSLQQLIALWASLLIRTETEPATWEELATEVFSLASADIAAMAPRAQAEESDELTARQRLDFAATCSESGDWSAVLDALKKPLKRIKDPQERLAEWVRCVVVETAAELNSFGWQHNWEGRPTLVDAAGRAFEPESIAQLLLDGKPAQARQALEAALVENRQVENRQVPGGPADR